MACSTLVKSRLGHQSAAAFLALTATILISAQPAPLTLVSTEWPPFTNPQGRPRFALDLVEAGLHRVNLTANTTIVTAADFTRALVDGPFDGSAAAWKDAERERVLVYSQPYLENRLVLVGRHGADVAAKALAELKGKRVAIVSGYSYGDAVDAGGPVFVRSQSEEDSLDLLLKSSVDYTLMDELVVQYILSNHPQEASTRLQIGATALVTRELYLAIRRSRPDAASIVSRFNAQLRGMIADGTYHRMLQVDWIRADVNGDGIPEDVPRSDRPGPTAPQHVYSLFSATRSSGSQGPVKPGVYVGGTIYSDWASVPQNYKVSNSSPPDSRRSTASLFNFRW